MITTAPSHTEHSCDIQRIDVSRLERLLRNGTAGECRNVLTEILEESGYYRIRSLMMRLYVAMEIYILACSFAKELGIPNEEFIAIYGNIDDIERNLTDPAHATDFFEDMLKRCIDWRIIYSCENSGSTVNKAVEYIRYSYMCDEMSLTSAAAHVGLSPTYFSTLFKKETGRNFSDFLSEVRIEKAKELLSRTCMPINEVAYEVGFSDYRYFGQIFKKHTGMTPREFHSSMIAAKSTDAC